jgi:hypothetical protein
LSTTVRQTPLQAIESPTDVIQPERAGVDRQADGLRRRHDVGKFG